MNQTVEFDYRKYLQLIIKKRHLFLVASLVIMLCVTISSYLLPERYKASSTVFIEKSVISELVKGIAVTPSIEDKIRVLAYAIRSRALLTKVLDDLDMNVDRQSPAQQEKLLRDVEKNTDIKLKDREGLFIISYTDKDPRRARDFVNTLVRRYIEQNITAKREESYGATRFLGEQIASLKTKLEESEEKVNSYRRQHNGMLGQSEAVAQAEISEAQQELERLAAKRHQLERLKGQPANDAPLKVRLAHLHKKQQELRLTYTDQHPELQDVTNEIATIREQLKAGPRNTAANEGGSPETEKINFELSALRDTEERQRNFVSSRQHLLRTIPSVRAGLDEIERERNSQRALYEQLMARYGQSEVSKQLEVQDKTTTFRVVDPAVTPTKPVSPQRVKIILFGIVGGLLAGFGLLVLLDHHDKSIRTVDTLRGLGLPILAVVPPIPDPAAIETEKHRDRWFYATAGVCFLVVLATVPIELVRYLSIDIFSWGSIKHSLSSLKSLALK